MSRRRSSSHHQNAAATHEPCDLINDDQVAANASSENLPEASVFTIERANAGNLNPNPVLASGNRPQLRKFLNVAVFQHMIGSTHINFVTYVVPGSEYMVRIGRKSAARHVDGEWATSCSTYEFRVAALKDSSQSSKGFIMSMVMLVEQSTARAIRHIWTTLNEFDDVPDHLLDEMERADFLPGRVEDYRLGLDQVARPVNLELLQTDGDGKLESSIYRIPIGEAPDDGASPETAVTLRCGHTFGRNCLFKLYSNGQSPKCPLCRRGLYSDQALRFLAFGTVGGTYVADARYLAHENFEHSCADLD